MFKGSGYVFCRAGITISSMENVHLQCSLSGDFKYIFLPLVDLVAATNVGSLVGVISDNLLY